VALDIEQPHAVGTHVAEGHWRARQPPWPLSAKAAAVADMLSCLLMTQAVRKLGECVMGEV
jgi:hypothetical protein